METMTVNPAEILTPRQVEIIAMLASGHDSQTIATAKFLSYRTVRRILHEARESVGATTLAQLCTLSLESGCIARNGVGFKPVVDPYSAE